MTVLLEMNGSVKINAGPVPRLIGKISLTQDPIRALYGEINIDLDYSLAVKPRGLNSQMIAIALEIEDYGIFKPTDFMNGISFDRTLNNGSKIEFSLPVDSRLGTEIQWKGPPPGNKKCTLWTGYVVGGSVKWSKYITGAISDSSSRPIGDNYNITINLLGPEFANVDQKISYVLQQGHKKSTEEVIREILLESGVNKVSISNGSIPKNREVQINCREGIPVAKELANSLCKVIYFDRDGYAKLLNDGLIGSQIVSQTLNELDILESSVGSIESNGGEVPTRVIFSGYLVNLDEECGRKTVVTRTEVKKKFIPPRGRFRQTTIGGVVSHLDEGSLPAEDITESLVIRVVEYECNSIISERVMRFSWYNPIIPRYRIDINGDIDTYLPGFFQESSIGNISDSSNIHLWQESRFVQTHDELIIYDYADVEKLFYEDIGWEYPPKGVNYRIRKFYSGWGIRQAALKQRTSHNQIWEDQNYINGRYILGSGEGVDTTLTDFYSSQSPRAEVYSGYSFDVEGTTGVSFTGRFLQYQEEIKHNTHNGFITSEDSISFETQIVPGNEYLFFGDIEGKDEFENVLDSISYSTAADSVGDDIISVGRSEFLSEKIIISYSADESSGLTIVKAVTDYKIANPITELFIESTEDSYLPKSVFKGDNSSESVSQQFEVDASADILLISHPYHERLVEQEWIENIEDAKKYCVWVLREESSLPITFSIPFNIPLDPGQLVNLTIRRAKINHQLVFIKEVKCNWAGVGNFIKTDVVGQIYVI